jgi:hypothetical protein
MLGGFPFQFPLPISGNTGVPKLTDGNIDILARRGSGKGTKISVWELKRPNTTAHAISQLPISTRSPYSKCFALIRQGRQSNV